MSFIKTTFKWLKIIAIALVSLITLIVIWCLWTQRIEDAPFKVIDTGIWPEDRNILVEPVWLDNDRIYVHSTANHQFGNPPYQGVIYNTKTKAVTSTPFPDVNILCVRHGNLMFTQEKPNGDGVTYRGTLEHAVEYPAPKPDMHIDTRYDCDWVSNVTFEHKGSKLFGDNRLELIQQGNWIAEFQKKRYERGQPLTHKVIKGKVVYHIRPEDQGVLLPHGGGISSYSEYLDTYVLGMDYYDSIEQETSVFWLLDRNSGQIKEIPYPKNMLVGRVSVYPVKAGYLMNYAGGPVTEVEGTRGLYLMQGDRIQRLRVGSTGMVSISPDGCGAAFIQANSLKEYLSPTKPYRTLKYVNFC